MKKLKERLDRVFDVKSYGYVVDKRITRSAFLLILCLALFVLFLDGAQVLVSGGVYVDREVYVSECIDSVFVVNPLCELDEGSLLFEKPSWLARNFGLLAVLIFGGALFLNHRLNNKKCLGVVVVEKK